MNKCDKKFLQQNLSEKTHVNHQRCLSVPHPEWIITEVNSVFMINFPIKKPQIQYETHGASVQFSPTSPTPGMLKRVTTSAEIPTKFRISYVKEVKMPNWKLKWLTEISVRQQITISFKLHEYEHWTTDTKWSLEIKFPTNGFDLFPASTYKCNAHSLTISESFDCERHFICLIFHWFQFGVSFTFCAAVLCALPFIYRASKFNLIRSLCSS